ncbi:MAG: HEAT repeat domain-containing protein [Tepidisphaerales bacterium]
MRRINCAVLLAGMLVVGCAKEQPDIRIQEPFNGQVWKQALAIDAERAKSETQREEAGGWSVTDKLNQGLWESFVRIYYWITNDSPFNAAKELLNPAYPDKRRQAVMYLSKRPWGREKPYTDFYVEMVKSDDEHLVRSIALRALNRARVADQTALYIKALDDKHELVRLEAAKALANMPDPKAMEPLIKHLQNTEENIDVRIACADALRHYKKGQSAQALVSLLRDRSFGLSWQARWTLKLMTGKDYAWDQAAWLQHLTKAEKPFG